MSLHHAFLSHQYLGAFDCDRAWDQYRLAEAVVQQ
jgi:hypothetical protein